MLKADHQHREGNDRFEGFLIDLMYGIASTSSLISSCMNRQMVTMDPGMQMENGME